MATSCISLLTCNDNFYPKDKISYWLETLPVLYLVGNPNLLQLSLTALFCSRKCPGDAILKAYDLAQELRYQETPVISGFHTPVEKDMLDILLKGKSSIVVCPARGLEGMRLSLPISRGIGEGRVLLLSIFGEQDKRIVRNHCEARNNLVAALASKTIFIHYDPSGNLAFLYKRLEELQS